MFWQQTSNLQQVKLCYNRLVNRLLERIKCLSFVGIFFLFAEISSCYETIETLTLRKVGKPSP